MRSRIQNLIILSLIFVISSARSLASRDELFLDAKTINYQKQEQIIYASGGVKLLFKGYRLSASRILYDIEHDMLWAEGQVRIVDQQNQIITGETVFLSDSLKKGVITNFAGKLMMDGVIAGKLMERAGKHNTHLYCSNFTPCKIGPKIPPIWQISAQETHIDTKKHRMTYKNIFFEVYGVPVLYLPYLSHPASGARASSGFLIPEIRRDELRMPVYWRIKPNMDATITPRIAKKHSIIEGEFRHRLKNGSYIIHGSYAGIDHATMDENEIERHKDDRYHLFASGDFKKGKYSYGFDGKITSDKAYLKNYHDYKLDYLDSFAYLNKVDLEDYYSIKFAHFRNLRGDDERDVFLLPQFKIKKIFDIGDSDRHRFIIENRSLFFKQQSSKQIGRNSIKLTLQNGFQTSSGHLFMTKLRNRTDIYSLKATGDHESDSKPAHLNHNFSEAQISWHYPLVTTKWKHPVMVEPVVNLIFGKKRNVKKQINSSLIIDRDSYELSENNLFDANHYGGVNFYDSGNRATYGIYSSTSINNNFFSAFIGQLFDKNNEDHKNHLDYVGSIKANFGGKCDLYYKFRKNKRFASLLTEFGSNIRIHRAQIRWNYVKYSPDENDQVLRYINGNNIKQLNYKLAYDVNDNWQLGHTMRINLSDEDNSVLYRSISARYNKDCINLLLKLYRDYTQDKSRGIKQNKGTTISLGLKMISM